MNEQSSRSHMLFLLSLSTSDLRDHSARTGKLFLEFDLLCELYKISPNIILVSNEFKCQTKLQSDLIWMKYINQKSQYFEILKNIFLTN